MLTYRGVGESLTGTWMTRHHVWVIWKPTQMWNLYPWNSLYYLPIAWLDNLLSCKRYCVYNHEEGPWDSVSFRNFLRFVLAYFPLSQIKLHSRIKHFNLKKTDKECQDTAPGREWAGMELDICLFSLLQPPAELLMVEPMVLPPVQHPPKVHSKLKGTDKSEWSKISLIRTK